MEATSSTPPRSISSSSESDELLTLPTADQDEINESDPKKRKVQYVKKSTKEKAGTSSSTPPGRQQKSMVIILGK